MQNITSCTFGVSPAFFVSCFGETFGPDEVIKCIPAIAALGYTSFEAEIFDPAVAEQWTDTQAALVFRRGASEGLQCRVFAAHFIGDYFAHPESLENTGDGLDDLELVLRITEQMDNDPVIVVPMMPFTGERMQIGAQWQALVDKVGLFARRTSDSGVGIAIESVPGGLIEKGADFERLKTAGDNVSYLLDTGNVWAAGEDFACATDTWMNHLGGIHVCDTDGIERRSLEPGTGDIPWPTVIDSAKRSSYTGSFDIEILCPADQIEDSYARALSYMQTQVET